MQRELVLATTNKGKIKELKSLLPSDTSLLSLSDIGFDQSIDEPFQTFQENAIQKARVVSEYCGKPTLADDSGLVVPSLGGAPGVQSARYAGENASSEENIAKLLEKMKDLDNREAYFVSVLAWCNGQEVKTFQGTCNGKISIAIEGAEGFGYDPVFIPEGYTETFGVLPSDIKNSLSHRAKAIEKFIKEYTS